MDPIHQSVSDFLFIEDQPQTADIIFVPGGSKPELMEKACVLFKAGLAPYILPSGGENINIPLYKTEWDYFLDIANRNNIGEEKVLKENKAKNTFENARYSKEIVDKIGIKIEKAILVCKAFHARRALLTYQTEFANNIEYYVCPIIDERNIRKDNWYYDQDKINKVMNEVEKIGKYFSAHMYKLNNN